MVDADAGEFKAMVEVLAMNFNKKLTPKFIDLLFRGLRSLPMETVKLGFARALETCKFFPTVAELREAAAEAAADARVEKAWSASHALPAKVEWDMRVPEVGEFRRYLEELTKRKSSR